MWHRLLRCAGAWALSGFGFWALRERATGTFVGEAGFHNLRRELDPPPGDRPELGHVLAPSAHGRGYATEASRAVVA